MVAPANAAASPEQRPPKPPPERGTSAWPLPLVLTVKRSYLVHCLSPIQIATSIGRTPKAVRCLIARKGWRRDATQLEVRKSGDKSSARDEKDVAAVNEAVATMSEAVLVGGLERAQNAVDADDAKSFRMWSAGSRDLMTIARTCRGLDAPRGSSGADGEGRTINLSFFVGNISAHAGATHAQANGSGAAPGPQQPARDLKTVGPVVDVVAT